MDENITNWVADRISEQRELKIINRMPGGFLLLKSDDREPFPASVIGIKGVIQNHDIQPAFSRSIKPKFIVNVPSNTLWSGAAILAIHNALAAFGTLGELFKAARLEDPSTYRNKEWGYFYRAIAQHSNVQSIELIYESVVVAHRRKGKDLTIAFVDAYNMSAEDVRNAVDQLGHFNVIVKMSNYGSITSTAAAAATSIGVQALDFKGLMQYLAA